jgi:phosphate starvation-inducible membrane PsiE
MILVIILAIILVIILVTSTCHLASQVQRMHTDGVAYGSCNDVYITNSVAC